MPVRFPLWIAALATTILVASPATADNATPNLHAVAYGNSIGVDIGRGGCCETIFASDAAPEWLDRIVEKLKSVRSRNYQIKQQILFKVEQRPRYLAIVWHDAARGRDRLQVFGVRVVSEANVRLRGLMDLADANVSIVYPTGLWIDRGGAPLLVVSYGSGGSGYEGHGIKIVRLAGGAHDMTPVDAGRAVLVGDVDGNSDFEVIASDDRWANFFDGCGACGPHVPILFRLTQSGFRPACRSFDKYYREHAALFAKASEERDPGLADFGAKISEVLALIQGGMGSEGANVYRLFLEQVRSRLAGDPPDRRDNSFLKNDLDNTEKTFSPIVEEAVNNVRATCPVSALPASPRHPGAVARIRYFQSK